MVDEEVTEEALVPTDSVVQRIALADLPDRNMVLQLQPVSRSPAGEIGKKRLKVHYSVLLLTVLCFSSLVLYCVEN